MSYYKELNLPANPIKNIPNVVASNDGQILRDPFKELTDEMLDTLASANIVPETLFYFCKGDAISSANDRVLHLDLTRSDPKPWLPDDDPATKNWRKIICGVNWEVTGSNTEFSFWDTSNLLECYPVRQGLPLKYDYLNSVHFIKRGNLGVPLGAVKLDQILLSANPVLVRTEIPHSTTYQGQSTRLGVSLRFKETWSCWEEAIEKFSPLLKN